MQTGQHVLWQHTLTQRLTDFLGLDPV